MNTQTPMKPMTLQDVANSCGGRLICSDDKKNLIIKNISIDSRKIKDGFLYIPINGEHFDGHDFITSAFESGAVCTLTEYQPDNTDNPHIVVKSTFQALKDIAEYYRSLFSVPVIGISGSSGKTSTKELIYSVLSEHFNVLKTEGNLNNEIGVPQTLFNLRDEHEAAVIEMGINHFGEMTNIAKMVRPDIAVITNIGCAHLEFLGSRDGILKAKTEMFKFLSKDGIAVLNGDDDKLSTVDYVDTCFFGFDTKNDFYSSDIKPCGLDGTQFKIVHNGDSVDVFIPSLGKHMILNALAAYAIARRLSMPEEKIISGIRTFKNIDGRFNIIKTDNITIINDCYNANPESVKASLEVMGTLQGRRVAILADMGELGDNSSKMHTETGAFAAQRVDVLICIGKQSKFIIDGAQKSNSSIICYHFDTNSQAIEKLKGILEKDDTVLVKGSHAMKLEEITESLKNQV